MAMVQEEQVQKICASAEDFPPAPAEDAESDPSTEIGSEDSDSDYSDDDNGNDLGSFGMEDTILIFDWDDTVLPSTWIQEQGLRLDDDCILSDEQTATLDQMAEHAAQTLKTAKLHGKVILVTNAERGWIELSCQKFMPALSPALADVKILSARSTYEQQGVTSPFEWKFRAFEVEIHSFFDKFAPEQRKNVISFGDSAHEREALIRVTEHMQSCNTKSLKFVER